MRKLFTFLIASSLLFACNKEDNNVNPISNAGNANIIVFESYEEYQQAVSQSLERTPEERKAWEESYGIQSLGSKCDEFYESINPEDYKTISEIKDFVQQHNDFLQLIEDENGEYTLKTRMYNVPERYMVNDRGMYQINNFVYKVFETGKAYAAINNIDILDEIDEFSVKNLPSDSKVYYSNRTIYPMTHKDANNNCGTYVSATKTSGNNRTTMTLQIVYDDVNDTDPLTGQEFTVGTAIYGHYSVIPEKKTIFWFGCSRTISCHIDTGIDVKDGQGLWQRSDRFTKNRTNEFGRNLTGTFYNLGLISVGETTRDFHFAAYYAWGDTPDTDRAKVACNTQLGL